MRARSIWNSVKFLQERPVYTLGRKQFIEKNNTLLWLGAGIFVVVLLFRSWDNFSHPAFYVEDASYYFKINYDAGFEFKNIFRNPNGYFNIFNNFIAQLISKLDIRIQARAYLAVAFTLSVLTVILFGRSGLIKNKYLILVTPLAIGLSGLNHIHYYTTITFQMYLLVISLFLLLLWEKQTSFLNNLLIFLLIPILVWSGPYSVLSVPFAILFMCLFRGKNLIMLWTIIATIAYTLMTTGAVGSGIIPQNLFSEFYQNLWFETVVTDVFFMGLRGNANIEKVLLLLALIGPALYVIRHDTIHVRILVLLMVVIICTPAPLILTNKHKLYGDVFPCHLLTAHVSWILFVLILVDRVITKIAAQYQSSAGFAALALVVLFVATDNVKNERKGRHIILHNVPEFLQTIKEYEQSDLKEKNQNVLVIAEGVGIFDPTVIVGSRKKDAVRIKGIYIPQRRQ